MGDMDNIQKNLYLELNESLKLVFDITSRIDERTKILIENNTESKMKIEKLHEQQLEIISRITVLENKNYAQSNAQAIIDMKNELAILEGKVEHLSERCIHIEKDFNQASSKWAGVIDFIFKVGVVVIGSIILWKLGIKP